MNWHKTVFLLSALLATPLAQVTKNKAPFEVKLEELNAGEIPGPLSQLATPVENSSREVAPTDFD